MDFLKDKVYEEMDWLTKAVAPILDPLHDLLAKLPDVIEIDRHTIHRIIKQNGVYNIEADTLFSACYPERTLETRLGRELSWAMRGQITKCYVIEINTSLPLIFNLDKPEDFPSDAIKLVKHVPVIENASKIDNLGRDGMYKLGNIRYPLAATADVLIDLFDMKKEFALGSKSRRKRALSIYRHMQNVFQTNAWNIRDLTLANKIGQWMADYLTCEHKPALANLCKLRMRIDDGDPIYSIEEDK